MQVIRNLSIFAMDFGVTISTLLVAKYKGRYMWFCGRLIYVFENPCVIGSSKSGASGESGIFTVGKFGDRENNSVDEPVKCEITN